MGKQAAATMSHDGPLLIAVGIAGEVEVYRDKVRLKRSGLRALLNYGLKGDKDLNLASITAVQFKSAGLTHGYIQFSLPGGIESAGGLLGSQSDENTLMFTHSQQPQFEAVRELVDRLRRPPPPIPALPVAEADPVARAGGAPGRFRVEGVDKESGMDTTWYCSAQSAANAKVKAELQGIVVTDVVRVPS